jgi:hypothetical protein
MAERTQKVNEKALGRTFMMAENISFQTSQSDLSISVACSMSEILANVTQKGN